MPRHTKKPPKGEGKYTMRQTRVRSRLKNAPPLMKGLGHNGRSVDPLAADPANIGFFQVLDILDEYGVPAFSKPGKRKHSDDSDNSSSKREPKRSKATRKQPAVKTRKNSSPLTNGIPCPEPERSSADGPAPGPIPNPINALSYHLGSPPLTDGIPSPEPERPSAGGPAPGPIPNPINGLQKTLATRTFVQVKDELNDSDDDIVETTQEPVADDNTGEANDDLQEADENAEAVFDQEVSKQDESEDTSKNASEGNSVPAVLANMATPSGSLNGETPRNKRTGSPSCSPPLRKRRRSEDDDGAPGDAKKCCVASEDLYIYGTTRRSPIKKEANKEIPGLSLIRRQGSDASSDVGLKLPSWSESLADFDSDIPGLYGSSMGARLHYEWYEQYHVLGPDCAKVHEGCHRGTYCHSCHAEWHHAWARFIRTEEEIVLALGNPELYESAQNMELEKWRGLASELAPPLGGKVRLHPTRIANERLFRQLGTGVI